MFVMHALTLLPRLRKHTARLVLVVAVLVLWAMPARAQLIPSFGSDRAGTAGFQFLKIPIDARSAAMGETVAANAMDASALFWNPALAAQTDRPQVGIGHTAYYADVALSYAAALYHLQSFGLTVGASLQALNSGEMDVTTEFEPFGTGETFRLVDLAAGLTVAQALTDLFSYGVTAKYVTERVADAATAVDADVREAIEHAAGNIRTRRSQSPSETSASTPPPAVRSSGPSSAMAAQRWLTTSSR